jgi:hypothetical protein
MVGHRCNMLLVNWLIEYNYSVVIDSRMLLLVADFHYRDDEVVASNKLLWKKKFWSMKEELWILLFLSYLVRMIGFDGRKCFSRLITRTFSGGTSIIFSIISRGGRWTNTRSIIFGFGERRRWNTRLISGGGVGIR